jgi:hypothetical protein
MKTSWPGTALPPAPARCWACRSWKQGCAAWLECRLIPERHTEDAYDTCFAEVVAAAADARIFSGSAVL